MRMLFEVMSNNGQATLVSGSHAIIRLVSDKGGKVKVLDEVSVFFEDKRIQMESVEDEHLADGIESAEQRSEKG